MARLAALLALVACSGGLTTPTTSWRGAAVSGNHVPQLERAWQATPRDWEPLGWRVEVEPDLVRCPGWTIRVHGCTWPRTIRLSAKDPDRFIVDAWWELLIARRYDRTGVLCEPLATSPVPCPPGVRS